MVSHVAGVPGRDRLDEHDPALLCGNGIVADATWYHHELPGAELNLALLELDAKLPAHDEKQFVLSFVRVPRKLPFSFAILTYWSFTRPITLGDQYSVLHRTSTQRLSASACVPRRIRGDLTPS